MPCNTRTCLLTWNEIFTSDNRGLVSRDGNTRDLYFVCHHWCKTYSKGRNIRGMYFVGTHCGGRLAQQKEIHKECNLLALIGESLVSRWKYQRNVFCLCRDCTQDRGGGEE